MKTAPLLVHFGAQSAENQERGDPLQHTRCEVKAGHNIHAQVGLEGRSVSLPLFAAQIFRAGAIGLF